ncbi:MAG: gliding motility-associated C-terminal domain-containing protein [Saprospiraceae bacterium]|nr:gliding motility-associated C-terminal domain-containing protein [Saprospiraceae bacterium]
MAKRYTFLRLILPFALFVIPYLLRANGDPSGDPQNIKPTNLDSLTRVLGHCNPIVQVNVNCADQTILLRAFVDFAFSGQRVPIVAQWNTGELSHIIIVEPPGAWSWDPTGTGCEPNHWDNEYEALGPFFDGPLEITGPLGICPGESYELDVLNPQGSVFQNINWAPVNSSSIPLSINGPGTYTLSLTDEFGCPFTDQIIIPASPVVAPALQAPQAMCPENDTAFVQVAQMFNHYLWSTGDTLNPLLITLPGTYSVTVTNHFGCTGTQEITVNSAEVQPITITLSAPAICPGQNDILTAPPGFTSYVWSNGDLGITNIVTQPGTYEVTVTNSYGCTGTGSATVDALPTPTIAVTTTPFCPGGSSTLNVTGGNFPQYLWSSGQTTNPISVSTPGTYTVTVSGATICSTNTTVTVVQLPPPTTVIAQPAQLNCTAPQTNLNAIGSSADSNFTFVWTTVGGNFVSGQNTLTPAVDAAGTYTLQITNTQTGCTSSASVTVSSNMQAPPAPVGNPATLTCTVTNLNIGAVPLPTDSTLVLNWVASGGGNIVSGQNTWDPNVNMPGTYTLTVTNPANGCTATNSVVISQNTALPTSAIAPPNQITCTMGTVALNGSGSSSGPNFTYLWTGGTISGPTNTISTTATAVGTYTLLVTNIINGCTAVSSVDVSADQNIPTALAAPSDTLNCTVLSVLIDASQSSSGPAFTYTWTGPGIISGQGTLQPTVDAPGTYILNLLNTANSCFATLSVVVPEDILPPVADAGQNATLNCVIPTLDLDGTASSTGPNFTYLWTTSGTGNIVSGATGLTPTVNMSGTYNLLVTNLSNGCTSTSTVQVMNDANAPAISIASPATLTCTTLQTVIDALLSTQGPTYVYTWTGPGIVSGQGTLQPTVNLPGVYTLDIVNSANGCTDTQDINVPQDIVAPVALAGPDGLINCTSPAGSVGNSGNPTGPNFMLQWSTVDGNFTSPTNGPTATIDAAGTYTLLITNNTNGCTDTDDVIVLDDFAPPAVEAGPTFELTCSQTTYVMQGTGSTGPNFQYLWTTVTGGNIVSGANTLTPLINASGTYNLLITNTTNGCTSNDQVVITLSADVPTSVIAQPATLTCTLTSFNLNANGTTMSPTISYTWTATNGGNITGGNTTLMPTIDAPGTYTLQTFDASNNCSSVAVVTVPENIVNPNVDAGSAAPLTCTVLTLPLQATTTSTNISYVWSTANGTIVSGGNTPTPTVGSTGTYTVLVTDNVNGCTATDNIQIIADVTPPVASIAQPATLTCTLQQTLVNATASSAGPEFTYVWTTPDGNIVSGETSNQPLVDDPGTYNLLITNTNNGCTQTSSINVPEDVVLPTAVAGPSLRLDCDTQSGALNGNGSSLGANFTYLWSTTGGQIISGITTLTPQIGDPGTYTLTVNNTQNGCVSTSSVVVTEDVNPPVFAIAPPQLLTCVVTNTALVGTGSGFGNAPTYTWATTGGNIVSGGTTLNAVADAPGTYTLTIVNTENGCTDVEQVVVTENVNPPVVNTQPVAPLTCSVLARTLQANAAPQALLQWTTLDGNIVSGANTPNPVVDEPGLYTVTATLPLNGCTAVANVPLLREQNVPTGLQFLLDPPLCNGTLGYLTVEQINGGIGPFQYSIDGGTTFFPAQDIDGLQPGTYDLVIQDVNGCEITQVIPVPTPPTPLVNIEPTFSIALGEDQELEAIVPPSFPLPLIDQVIWTPMTGLTFGGTTIQDLLNPVAMPFVTTEYTVTIISKEGCKATARTIIRVDRDIDIYAPNVIWPEDPDGLNGAFTLFTRQGSVNQILSLQIYDRWGEQLFVNKNFLPDAPSLGWPGDYKGEPVNPGVFVWWAEVELIDGQKILMKGDVTVVR